jgi:hypothetical protein
MEFVHLFFCQEHGHYQIECDRDDLEHAYDHAWKDFETALAENYREDEVPEEEIEEVVQNHIDEWRWEHIMTYRKGYAMGNSDII